MNEIIVLGGGCFWCSEAVFLMIKGVKKVTPGYAGGSKKNPTYEEVCSGETGHAEVVKVEYDSNKVKLGELLDVFFEMHGPTTPNRQGNDVGTQYRSVILYSSGEQKGKIEKYIEKVGEKNEKPIVTEVKKLGEFYPAEEKHLKYFERNPSRSYCRLVISPKVQHIRKKFDLK